MFRMNQDAKQTVKKSKKGFKKIEESKAKTLYTATHHDPSVRRSRQPTIYVTKIKLEANFTSRNTHKIIKQSPKT